MPDPATNSPLFYGDEDNQVEEEQPKVRKVVDPSDPERIRKAVDAALLLLGRKNTDSVTSKRSVVPSASARQEIERMLTATTLEDYTAMQPNMKLVAKALYDWPDVEVQGSATMATGYVAKTLGQTLSTKEKWCQGVEMAGYSAAISPLLDPDRLGKVIASAPNVETAFAPERYTLGLTGALRKVLIRYPAARRETLLIDLWSVAHRGRWWDLTSGVAQVVTNTEKNRRGKQAVAWNEEQVEINEHLENLLKGRKKGTVEADEVLTKALLEGKLVYDDSTVNLVRNLRPSHRLIEGLEELAANHRAGHLLDPDVMLLASYIPWLSPAQRPESPITWLVKTLVASLTDRETGEIKVDVLPNKPKKWVELYPPAELTGFPFPAGVYKLHNTTLPSLRDCRVEVVRNPAELAANRDYMGNCTWSYKGSMEAGTYVLFKLWQEGHCYNASATADGNTWHLREINSRNNRGGVPDDIRNAFVALCGQLPPKIDPTQAAAVREERTHIGTIRGM